MTFACCHKRRLRTISLVNKYKALKETEVGQSYIATLRKYDAVTLKRFLTMA